ncbi:hypothetical protein BC828DRAFT_377166 [Blastocladiella britannica]|nr:hypothetical protein BC828DRAFT_377166 [Blastocladiella britannica]
MCRWWRDRTVHDHHAFQIKFVDTDDSYGSDWNSEDETVHEVLRDFNIEGLVQLGELGLLETLQLWAEMADNELLPPLCMEFNQYHFDPLSGCKIWDPLVLEWWLQRHRSHGLAFPQVPQLLAAATAAARTDTLDWIWRASKSEMIQFTLPDEVNVTRQVRERAMGWWTALRAKHQVDPPVFAWEPSELDTRDDLQTFWDATRDSCVQVSFSFRFFTPDAELLVWLIDHRKDSDIHFDVTDAFSRIWKTRRFDGLEPLLDCYEQSGTPDSWLKYTVRNCLMEAASSGDVEFLTLWYDHPALRQDVESDLANWVLHPALSSG